MPDQQSVMSHEEPVEAQDEWLEEPEELPRRPRRRLLGTGANPVFLALLAVLLIACGFIGGVLIEKGETSASSAAGSGAAASLASRFHALRGATSSSLHERIGELDRRLRPPDRRNRRLCRRQHAVRDRLRRQHDQGHDLGGHERDQDRDRERQGHPSRRNGHRHRHHRLERRRQRRIDQRRLERRRSCGAVRRLELELERLRQDQQQQRTIAVWQRRLATVPTDGWALPGGHESDNEITNKGSQCLTFTATAVGP